MWYTGKLHISIRRRQLDSRASRCWVITSASHSVSCEQYNISAVVHITQNYHSVSSKNMCVLVQQIDLAMQHSLRHVLTCRSSEYLQKSTPQNTEHWSEIVLACGIGLSFRLTKEGKPTCTHPFNSSRRCEKIQIWCPECFLYGTRSA